jgi:ferric-dicitrate binding protein FerR (iron transport regulator)
VTHGAAAGPAPAQTPPPEVEWAHVQQVLHPPPVSHDLHHEIARHDAAEHVARIGKRRPWKGPVSVGLVVGAAVVGTLWYVDSNSGETVLQHALSSQDARAVSTRAAQQGQMSLDDGTRATLGPDSRITIPKSFGPRLRAVKAEGAMSFAVTSAGVMPFQVRVGDARVEATGADFSVRQFPGEPTAAVGVRTGSVTVTAGGAERTVGAGQALLVGQDGAMRVPTDAERTRALGWTTNQFVVDGARLADVLPQVVRWYATSLELDPASLGERVVSVRAPLGETQTLIKALEASGKLRFEWKDKKMMLRDAAAPATR